jgi:hypothetical protein
VTDRPTLMHRRLLLDRIPPMPTLRFVRLLAATVVVAPLACRDAAPTEVAADLTGLVPDGETHVMLQQLPGPTAGTITFVVRVVTRLDGVASYQGEVTFTPGAFELIGSSTPQAADGEMFLVNAQGPQGRIRFSALTTETFSTDEAFRFTVKPTRPVETAGLGASLAVVGTVEGAAVASSRVRSADGIRDVKGRLLTK